MRRPRSDGVILPHGPSSKAERAARTARSLPSAMRARVSPVAGFGVSNVLPDAASVHCPLMNNWRGVAMKASVFLSRVTVIGNYLLCLWKVEAVNAPRGSWVLPRHDPAGRRRPRPVLTMRRQMTGEGNAGEPKPPVWHRHTGRLARWVLARCQRGSRPAESAANGLLRGGWRLDPGRRANARSISQGR